MAMISFFVVIKHTYVSRKRTMGPFMAFGKGLHGCRRRVLGWSFASGKKKTCEVYRIFSCWTKGQELIICMYINKQMLIFSLTFVSLKTVTGRYCSLTNSSKRFFMVNKKDMSGGKTTYCHPTGYTVLIK